MKVSEVILKRRTIRKWMPVPVEKEKIEKVLEAGRRAPLWGNTQPWRRFIVVQDKAKIEIWSRLPPVDNTPIREFDIRAQYML